MIRTVVSSRSRVVALGALVVVLGGVACSAATTQFGRSNPAAAPTTAPAAASKSAVTGQSAAAPAAVPAAAGGAVVAMAPAPAAASDAQSGSQQTPAVVDSSAQILNRMVIRNAQLTVEVQDIEQALAAARAVASRDGGFVSASNTHVEKSGDHDQMVADLTLQVRSDAVDAAMSDLRSLGKVTAETSGSQDVTEEYVDLDSNLRNLQASETAILKLMDKATQIQDILSLQRELTNVRGQIERIQGRKTYLERRTDMATITLSLRLPPAPTTSLTGGAWDPIAVAQRGWQASLTLLRGVAEGLIIVLAFSWWLVPFVALGAYLWLHRRRPTAPVAAPVDMI